MSPTDIAIIVASAVYFLVAMTMVARATARYVRQCHAGPASLHEVLATDRERDLAYLVALSWPVALPLRPLHAALTRRGKVREAHVEDLRARLDDARRGWADSPPGSTEETIFSTAAKALTAELEALGERGVTERPPLPVGPSATSRGQAR